MPSNYDAEKRRLLHQKSQQLTTGYGKPSNETGKDGDIAFRQIEDSGTVQYLKSNEEWVAVSSSGLMPPQRIMMGGGSSSTTNGAGASNGITDHGYLSGKEDDDHSQYIHTSSVRTITANHVFTGTPTFTNGTFTSIDINGGTIDGTIISADSTQTEWDAAHTHSQIAGGDSVHVSTTENTQWDTAYTHSQIAGGDSVHVSTTENTQWDAAYTHSLDNSQAHSDYLINNGNDVTSGTLQINGTLSLATGSITDTSGNISFGDENLGTSGTLASGTQTVTGNVTASGTIQAEHLTSTDDATITDTLSVDGTMTLSTGSIIDSTGAITFGNENLSTTGTLDSGRITVDDGSSIYLQEKINFTGEHLANQIKFPDDLSSALLIGEGNTPYVAFKSSDGAERISFLKEVRADLDVDIGGDLNVTGIVDITNTTDSSNDSGDTGALRVEGGASIAKKLYVGTNLDVDGISNLDAVDIDGNVQVNNSTTNIDSTSAVTISGGSSSSFSTSDGNITIAPKDSFIVRVGASEVIKSDITTGMLYLKNYDGTDLWDANHYAINNKAQLNHFTTGAGDLSENFSILCKTTQPAYYETYLR
tara:strand:+ start:3827 stop:5596 length:1770 start_codon:yes stop_codon:yes gene_type:complete